MGEVRVIYRTLSTSTSYSKEIRKSRFVVHAAPVDSAKAALTFLQQESDSQSTHNCWAYRVGQEYRFSDDGEPAGTAGKPILQAIDSQQLDKVVVIVARYFGGIKLGAGGLIRAYGGCAAECLNKAGKMPLVPKVKIKISCSFSAMALLEHRLEELKVEKLEQFFSERAATVYYSCPIVQMELLHRLARDLTRGQAEITTLG